MFYIATSDTVLEMPVPFTTNLHPGWFAHDDIANGVPATTVSSDWVNMVQAELLNVVLAAGITPSPTSLTQVLDAIRALIQQALNSIRTSPPPVTPPPVTPPPVTPPPSVSPPPPVVSPPPPVTPPPVTPPPPTPPPAPTTANFYVNPGSGSDSNTGTSTTSAWATTQHAWNWLQSNYDARGNYVQINLVGTTLDRQGLVATGAITGCIGLRVDGTSPITATLNGNTSVSVVGSGFNTNEVDCLLFDGCSVPIFINNLQFTSNAATNESCLIKSINGSNVTVQAGNVFVTCISHMLSAETSGTIHVTSAQLKVGGGIVPNWIATAECLAQATSGGVVTFASTSIQGLINVTFRTGSMFVFDGGTINIPSSTVTFSQTNGSWLGPKFALYDATSTLNTQGGGINFLPGDQPGLVSGGTYI